MPPQNENVVIKEQIPSQVWQRVFLIVVFILIVVGASYYFATRQNQGDVAVTQFDQYGLDGELDLEYLPQGDLFFTAKVADEPQAFISIMSQSFDNDTSGVYAPYMARSFARIDSNTDLFIANVLDAEDPDGWRIVWRNQYDLTEGYVTQTLGWNETDLTASENGLFAYAYQTENKALSQTISDWNVAVHSMDGSTSLTIDDASEPQLSSDGAYLYYMKVDGIYRYTFADSTHTLLSNIYNNFSTIEDFAVSANGTHLIVTSPFQQMASVQSITAGTDAIELARLITPGVVYRHPVFSSDGNHYAVQASAEGSPLTLEVRQLNNATPVFSQPLGEYLPDSVSLQSWITEGVVVTETEE